jgi:circadian clock protein KaiC
VTGTGKTLLGIEFIYRGIVEFHELGLIIVFETNPGRLIRDAAAFGWNLEELQQQRNLQIIFTSPEVFDQQLRSTESLLLEIANETLETGTVNI